MSSELTNIWLVLRYRLVAAIALTLQSEWLVNYYVSYGLVTYTANSSPNALVVLTVVAVCYAASLACFSMSWMVSFWTLANNITNIDTCWHFHSQYDIPDFHLSEWLYIDIVLLGIVIQYEILQFYFHFDPFIIRESRPDVIWLSDDILIGFQYESGLLMCYMQCSEYQYQPGECSEWGYTLQPIIIQIE